MAYLQTLVTIASMLLLGVLPLVCCTSLADAVEAPKQAFFWIAATLAGCSYAVGAASKMWPWLPQNRVTKLAFLGYLWFLVSAAAVGLPSVSWPWIINALLLGTLLVCWEHCLTKDNIWQLVGSICLSGLVMAAYAHWQRLGGMGISLFDIPLVDPIGWNNPHLSQERTIATMGNPNYLAAWLVAILPLGLSYVMRWPSGIKRCLSLGLWLAVLLAMLLTQTRAAWVGVVCGGLVWTIFYVRSLAAQQRRQAYVTLAILTGLALLTISFAAYQQVQRGLSFNIVARLHSITDFKDLSFRTRVYFWESALRSVKRAPFTGVGPGRQTQMAQLDRDLEPVEVRYPVRNPENCHNQYLQIAAENGLVGLGLLLAALLAFFRLANRQEGLLVAGLAGAATCHWITQFFLCSTISTETLWVFVAAALAALTKSVPGECLTEDASESTDSPKVAGLAVVPALAVLLVALLSAGLLVAAERYVWLGDDARIAAETLSQSPQADRKLCAAYYQLAANRYQIAADYSPIWRQWLQYDRLGRVHETVYTQLYNSQDMVSWLAACENYQIARALDPSQSTANYDLARIYAQNPQTAALALTTSDQALSLDPYNPDYLLLRGQIQYDQKLYEPALQSTQRALDIYPLPRGYYLKASILLAMNKPNDAEQAMQMLLRLDPTAIKAVNRMRKAARN